MTGSPETRDVEQRIAEVRVRGDMLREPPSIYPEERRAIRTNAMSSLAYEDVPWLLSQLDEARRRVKELEADKQRLDWLQEFAYQLSTTDEGETCDAKWNVFPNAVDVMEDTIVPSGYGVRGAIDAARAQ